MWSRLGLVLLVVFWVHFCSPERPPIICRDPDVGGTKANSDRQFLILGAENTGGAGVGNLLIFFPAAFYYAAVTGRDIVITDNSVLGGICKIIYCGFPFVSQIQAAFPNVITGDALAQAPTLKHGDFIKYIEGSLPVNSPVVRAGGFLSKSDWWVWFNTTVHCVQRITGCDLGDVMCAERHAYQRLIRGPFREAFSEKEEARISGVPKHIKHALVSVPHVYSPRLDVAVHLRCQFAHFESQTEQSHPEYKAEVYAWLNSSEATQVFAHMEEKIFELISGRTDHKTPFYIYLAADNEDVKDRFEIVLREKLTARNHALTQPDLLFIMKVDAQHIAHVKDFNKFNSLTQNEGLLDLVFDWYALSLANTIFAWRKGGTNMLSTFVHSAQKVSGTTERTDNGSGRGLGTRGFQLIRDKRGNLRFDPFWGYSFLEDFQQKR